MPGQALVYKCTRVTSSKTSILNLPQVLKDDFSSHSDGQHGGSDLPEENEGTKNKKMTKIAKEI